MNYTEQQAIEAIRQHPHLAAKMALTHTEFFVLKAQGIYFRSKDLVLCGLNCAANASRTCKKLSDKGYIKKIKNGSYVKL